MGLFFFFLVLFFLLCREEKNEEKEEGGIKKREVSHKRGRESEVGPASHRPSIRKRAKLPCVCAC